MDFIIIIGKYKKIQNSNILILGAGGTGGTCALSLARLGFGNLTVVDFDKVELNNLNRQIYNFNDIGLDKTFALSKHIKEVNPFINLSTVNKKINNLEDLLELGCFDLIICCIDKPSNMNDIMDEDTKVTNTARILGGYASTIISSGIFTSEDCRFKDLFDNSKDDNYNAENVFKNTFWKWDNAIISPVANIAGNMLCFYAFYYLTNLGIIESGVLQHIDVFIIQNNSFCNYIDKNGLKEME